MFGVLYSFAKMTSYYLGTNALDIWICQTSLYLSNLISLKLCYVCIRYDYLFEWLYLYSELSFPQLKRSLVCSHRCHHATVELLAH